MRLSFGSTLLGVSALSLLVGCGGSQPSPVATNPTFHKDIAPIIWQRCAGCHRPGEIGPFSLLTYADVRSNAQKIVNVTTRRIMPPWLPETDYGNFLNQRRLTSDEIDRIARWVELGAPEGDSADGPPPPTWVEGWQLGQPDLVVESTQAYALKPGDEDVFRNFVIPIPTQSVRFVRAIEVRPGNRRIVHHVSIAIDRTRASRRLDDEDSEPGFAGGMFSETTTSPDSHALGWTPGMTPVMDPPDMAWRLETDTDLVLQMHLLPSRAGVVETVRPSVGFFFTDTPPTRSSLDFKLGSKDIDIPAGQADYTIEDSFTLPVDVDVVSIYPHAHYLAREMKAFATRPDGGVTGLIWIKDWDFHWQDQYRYATPVALSRGTVVTMRYTYDNSEANEHNPSRPPRHVEYGPQSSDEMGDLWLRLVPHSPADRDTLARAYIENERRKNIGAAERKVALHPRDAPAHAALGSYYVEAGRLDDAVAQFDLALRVDPRNLDARSNLGHVAALRGQNDDAVRHFRAAARLAPRNALVQLNLANVLQDAGNLGEAIAHFRQAVALDPDDAIAQNALGVALASRGLIDEAATHFKRALEIRPGYADAQQNLDQARTLQASP